MFIREFIGEYEMNVSVRDGRLIIIFFIYLFFCCFFFGGGKGLGFSSVDRLFFLLSEK